jgi:multidrug resistance efflux pump
MNSRPPKLRKDLIVRTQQTSHETSVIVKDPISRKFFRMGEVEQFIAEQLDGRTPLEAIRQRVEVRFGGELPMETLNGFLQNLNKYGFLEPEGGSKSAAYREPPRFRGSALYCRFKVFDPCQILKRLVSRTGFFYTPHFLVLSAATILAAAGVTISHWSEFREELPRLYTGWASIAAVILLNFLVVGAHEFGHGLTCTRFGGEVHEMGCALIFLQPAFYCNVSDAWLFPEKSKRLWVGFAGPYFELFLWSLAVLTWRMTEPDTWINFVTLSVMATSGLKTLLNFNPLIKLDGYYLLSDYLELPNMRRRSFRYVGSLVEKLFGLGPEDEENLAPRERLVFSLYGTTALAGSFSILGYIILTAGGALVDGRSPTAVLVTLGLLGMRYRRRFRRMFAKSSGASGGFDDEDFDSPEEDVVSQQPSPVETAVTAEVPDTISATEKLTEKHMASNKKTESAKSKGPVTRDQLLQMVYARHVRRLQASSSGVGGSFGSGAIETSYTVTTLEEPPAPAPANDAYVIEAEAAEADTPPETPVPKYDEVTPSSDKTVGTRAPEPPVNGHKAQSAAISTVEPPAASENGDHAKAPDTDSGPEKPAEEKKKKPRWGRRVRKAAWVAAAAAAAFALVRGHAELRIGGPFNVLPVENSDVRASVDGVVDKIYVHEGDYVHEGQPIAQLTDIDTRAALEKTEAQLAEAGAKLKMQVAGPTANEIEVAKANVTKAEDSLKYAQIKLAMVKRVFDENLISRKEYEDTAALESAARNELAVAKDQLNLLLSGTRPEDIEATRAQIEQLKSDQRHLGEQRRMLMVYSPSDGVVATPTLQLKQLTHQLVKKGDLIAKIFDLRTVTAQIAVDEKDIADVQVNQPVVLRARAYPDEIFYGKVNFVSTSLLGTAPAGPGGEAAPLPLPSASSSSAAKRTILITTQIDNHSLLLKPEMTGQAKILCGRRRALDLVTRRLAHTIKVEFWSWL